MSTTILNDVLGLSATVLEPTPATDHLLTKQDRIVNL